jgi:hypothetical protein
MAYLSQRSTWRDISQWAFRQVSNIMAKQNNQVTLLLEMPQKFSLIVLRCEPGLEYRVLINELDTKWGYFFRLLFS